MKAWPLLGIGLMQTFLFLAHWFIFHTLVVFFSGLGPTPKLAVGSALLVLAFSFIAAALLGYYFENPLVTLIYRIAAVWLGFLNFFFFAACLSWVAWFAFHLAGLQSHSVNDRSFIAATLFGIAFLAGMYGLFNALFIRVRHVPVKLPNLPPSWQGRTALLISDLHLGNVNRRVFTRRVANIIARLSPDVVFLPGDLFDGVKADPDRLAEPFKELSPRSACTSPPAITMSLVGQPITCLPSRVQGFAP